MSSPLGQAEVKLGTCHCLQYHSHMFHTRIPGLSSPTTDVSSVVVIHPRGLSDETTSLGQWVQRWKGSQLQAIKPSHLDDFCSANNCLQEGQPGCGRTGRTARRNAPSYPTASQTLLKGLYFIAFQVALLPDPSGHTSGCLE